MNIALSGTTPAGPLGNYQDGFFDYVTLLGYSPRRCLLLQKLFADLDRWLAVNQLGIADICDEDFRAFVADRVSAGRTTSISMRAMKPVISYLRECGVEIGLRERPAAGPLTPVIEGYRKYLLGERGIQSRTAERYIYEVKPFWEVKAGHAGDVRGGLSNLTDADIIAFVAATCPKMTRSAAAMFVTALRAFLTFLHLSGIIDRSMTASVPAVPGRKMSNLPKGIEPDVLKLLLDSCDRKTARGARRYAILMLLSRLGLRAGEVAKLQLENIKWRSGEIVIAHAKGCQAAAMPLPADVGEAVADYLANGRPQSARGRTAFVRLQAPHGPMTSGAVSQAVRYAAQHCGLSGISAHRLRHTAATEMLRNGASLPEVGQVLRHRQMITTAMYAKVDREGLRSIARVWPGDVV